MTNRVSDNENGYETYIDVSKVGFGMNSYLKKVWE